MKRLDFFKTLSIFIFLLLIPQISVNAQIDIKSKVDAETYANYSKAIDLFEKNLNPNDVVTLFIPINYSFTRLSQEKQSALLNNISTEVSQFLKNHSTSTLVGINYFESNLNSDISKNSIVLLNNNKIYFQRDGNKYLLSDSYSPTLVTFESHVTNSIYLSNNIILKFLDGIFLY